MTQKTRTDELTLTTETTIVITDDEWENIDLEHQTKSEHVERVAEQHVKDKFNNPRGHSKTTITSKNEYPSTNKTVYECLTHYRT